MLALQSGLPDQPRLRAGCHVVTTPHGLIVRSVAGAFRIEPTHRPAMERVLARLDGSHDFAELLSGETAADAFYALRLLSSFAQSGLLADGQVSTERSDHRRSPIAATLDGLTVVMLHSGLFAGALRALLSSWGATVLSGDVVLALRHGAIALAAPDEVDLRSMDDANLSAAAAGVIWLPILPFGDGTIVGPLVNPSRGPCFRCLELRWLEISPSIALERTYLSALRSSSITDVGARSADDAYRLVEDIAGVLLRRLTGADTHPRAALILQEPASIEETRLIPHPGCPVCSRTASCVRPTLGEEAWHDRSVPLSELRGTLEEMTGLPCGLATIAPRPATANVAEPDLVEIAVARFALPEPDEIVEQDNWCHGAAATDADARSIAIIEAIERYSGLSAPSSGLVTSYRRIAAEALLPTDLPLFSDDQYARPGFPFLRFHADRDLRWTWGFNVTRGRRVLVPASAAWYGYHDWLLADSSNGVAAHGSRRSALVNGVLELVERDAFMIHWLHRLSPPHLDLPSIRMDRNRTFVEAIERNGYAVHVLDLTTDLGIPVVLVLGVHELRRLPALIVGAGAGLDTSSAALRALGEAYAASVSRTTIWIPGGRDRRSSDERVTNRSPNYENPESLQHVSFLWSSECRSQPQSLSPPGSSADALTVLTERLGRFDHDIIGIDITASDLAGRGVYVVRAVVPGLQPLALSAGPRLGGSRLYQAPVRMGCHVIPGRETDLNPVPNCFP